jgi:hypothetical protein
MAYTCDNPHDQPAAAFTVMSMPETGDTTALCAPCLLDWAYALLAGTEAGTDLIKERMLEIAAEAKVTETKSKRSGRKPADQVAEQGKATGAIPPATDTADPA